jgi:hypothetical protein
MKSRRGRTSDEITIDGVTMTLQQWAEYYHIPAATLRSRRSRGCTGKEIITGRQCKKRRKKDQCRAVYAWECLECPFPDCIRSDRRPLIGEKSCA